MWKERWNRGEAGSGIRAFQFYGPVGLQFGWPFCRMVTFESTLSYVQQFFIVENPTNVSAISVNASLSDVSSSSHLSPGSIEPEIEINYRDSCENTIVVISRSSPSKNWSRFASETNHQLARVMRDDNMIMDDSENMLKSIDVYRGLRPGERVDGLFAFSYRSIYR